MTDGDTFWQSEYERLIGDEEGAAFSTFGYDEAWNLGGRLAEIGRERALPIAVSVVLGEQRVFHCALLGSSALNDDWIERKIRVVKRHNMSSYAVGCLYRARGQVYDVDSRYDPRLYAAFGGAVPIRVGHTMVGVAAVSGLDEKDDHDLVMGEARSMVAELGLPAPDRTS